MGVPTKPKTSVLLFRHKYYEKVLCFPCGIKMAYMKP